MPHHKSAASCGEYIPKGINAAVIATQAAGQPVISIDTKKKEPIGSNKNGGSDYRQEGCPDKVNVHDFVDKELGKVAPYGVYDVTANAGCVSLGISYCATIWMRKSDNQGENL